MDQIFEGKAYLLRRTETQQVVTVVAHTREGYEMYNHEDGRSYFRKSADSLSRHYDGCCLQGCGCSVMITARAVR